jgi:hypothetical protein
MSPRLRFPEVLVVRFPPLPRGQELGIAEWRGGASCNSLEVLQFWLLPLNGDENRCTLKLTLVPCDDQLCE